MAQIDFSKYSHSPIHLAVLHRDHTKLRQLLSSLPRLSDPSSILTESDSLLEESKAETISSFIDRRDVPSRETPLHLAVRLGDATSAEMLMSAGADWSLQNEQGWSALQEAICLREETLAKIIIKHYQPLAWAKWCRRLPRVVNTMRRMRDFYMEITFHFESSVIPFISRIAPSDTYKIWKRGSNLRADMTLAGFDGFKIQRSDQTILFLGEGSEDGKIKPGSLCMINHKDKEIMNALEGAGTPASESEIQQEVNAMSQTNIFRPGIDVTQAVLLPQMTWRNKEKTEMVGNWKCKLYDMNNVMVSVKSRRVPGAMTDEEFFNACNNNNNGNSNNNSENNSESEEFDDILTEEEKRQLEVALKMDSELNEETGTSNGTGFAGPRHSYFEQREIPIEDPTENKQEKKGWFGNWGRTKHNQGQSSGTKKSTVPVPARNSLHIEEKVSDLLGEDSPPSRRNGIVPARHSISTGTGTGIRKVNTGTKKEIVSKESEYKKGLRPVLWLSPNFPLRTEELLPLLDILANKVKAIRRLRDLLTTKLPAGTFPVKVAIPVVPTIRVLVTFTKFEELQPLEEFSTPPSSPLKTKSSPEISSVNGSSTTESSSSWIQWMKVPYRQSGVNGSGPTSRVEDITDPFAIPAEYSWTTPEAKKKKMQESKNGKSKKGGGKS
ncbi:hypothetical protein LUZ60_002353 [Juncus effusus]|nr:hypothetical protein LUZ60_002353 [Juncus effusus]